MNQSTEKTFLYAALLIIASVMTWLAVNTNGTGDWGDAIFHYLFSSSAFDHPENFLNHWAKPVFVFFTAPVAQGGYTAIKLFNIGMLVGSVWTTWLVAKQLKIPNAWFVVFSIMTAPMSSYLTLSGLTEPMFAFWLIVGIYALVKEHFILGILWLSFLPFVRSEGLVVFCVLGLYLLVKKKWFLLPLLAVGHIVYGIAGHFYYKDFWWIFNKMSYATLDGAYGSGRLWHFADKMHTVLGDFQPILLVIGIVAGVVYWIRFCRGKYVFSKERIWLIYGIAVAYFVAHSIFWYAGIFNSFGLLRVMIGVIPLLAIIILEGVNFILASFPAKWEKYKFPFLVLIIGLQFFYLHKKLIYKFHFFQNAAQKGQNELWEEYGEQYKDYTYYFDAIHLALALEVDWFDPSVHRTVRQIFTGEPLPAKTLVIWDNVFTQNEWKIPLDKLLKDKRFKLITCKETGTWENPKPKSCLFELDSTYANNAVALQTSFEEPTWDKKRLDSLHTKTGKYSLQLNSSKAYSGSFTGWLTTFNQVPNAYIRISCWVYREETALPNPPQAIISFESTYKSFSYHSKPLFDKNDPVKTWKYVTFEQPVPKAKMFSDQVKAYIWNANANTVLIDDLKVEWFSE